MKVVVAAVRPTPILWWRASGVASPVDVPLSTLPALGMAPVRARIASKSVVLPLWKGPTNAMHDGPRGLLTSCPIAASWFGARPMIGSATYDAPPGFGIWQDGKTSLQCKVKNGGTLITYHRKQARCGYHQKQSAGLSTGGSFFLVVQPQSSAVLAAEVEQVEQIADRRAVGRNVRVALRRNRVRIIVPAAVGDRLQAPIALDELDDRDVIGVVVRDVARDRVRRDHDQGNAGAVAEIVERLHIA